MASELAFRDYIKQLHLIDADDDDLLAAVNDYLRAAVDRTAWAEKGLISEASLETMADELTITWRNKKDRVLVGFSDKPEHLQGRLIYRDCMDHDAHLDGLETPRHFVRGSWHTLSDDRAIGWHPRYKDALDSVDLTADGMKEL